MKRKRFFFLTLQLFYCIILTQRFPQGENCSKAPDSFNATCSVDVSSPVVSNWGDMFWTLNGKRISSDLTIVENNFTISIILNNADNIEYNLQCFSNNISLGLMIIKGKLPKIFEPNLPIIYNIYKDWHIQFFWKDSEGGISVERDIWSTLSLSYKFLFTNTSKETKENVSFVGESSQYILTWNDKLSTFFFPHEFENTQQMSLSNKIPHYWNTESLRCPNKTLQNMQENLCKAEYIRYSQEIFVNWTFSACDKALIRNSVVKICDAEDRQEKCIEKFCSESCWFKNLTSFKTYILKSYHFLQIGSVFTFLSNIDTKPSDPVSNVTVVFMNTTQISLSWNSPNHMGGEFGLYYIIYENKFQHKVRTITAMDTSLSMNEGIEGYKTYIFTISVFIKNATELSDPVEIEVTNGVGNPSDIQHSLNVYPGTDPSNLTLHWKPPNIRNGPIDYYLLSYTWEENGKEKQVNLQLLETSKNLKITCNLGYVYLYKFQVRAVNINSTEAYKPSNDYVKMTVCKAMKDLHLLWIILTLAFTGIMLGIIGALMYLYFQRCVKWLSPAVILPEKMSPSTVYNFSDKKDQISSCDKCCFLYWKKDKSIQGKSDNHVEIKKFSPSLFSDDSGFGDSDVHLSISSNRHIDKKLCTSVTTNDNFNEKFDNNKKIIDDNLSDSNKYYGYLMSRLQLQNVKPKHLSTSAPIIDNIIYNALYKLSSDDRNLNKKSSNMDILDEMHCYINALKQTTEDESTLQCQILAGSKSLEEYSGETPVLPNIEETFLVNSKNLPELDKSENIHTQNNEKLPEYSQITLQDKSYNKSVAGDKDEISNLNGERMQLSEESLNTVNQKDTVVPQSKYCMITFNNSTSEIVSPNLVVCNDVDA